MIKTSGRLPRNRRARIEGATFHTLRYLPWASLSVMNGVPLMVIARKTPRRPYAHVLVYITGHLAPYVAEAIRAGAPRFGTVPQSKIVGMR